MASSYADQIPVVVHLLQKLRPRTLLDVGKGFGKYGFLAHEYVGVPMDIAPDPRRTLAEQSALVIDAVEVQATYLWPHLAHFYRHVQVGRIEELYLGLPDYDLVLMADVIEHLEKPAALEILRHLLARGSTIIVTTPRKFYRQDLFQSVHERHVSHWEPSDFAFAPFVDYQNAGDGRVFLLAKSRSPIRGFGRSLVTRARRVARLLLAEFR